MEQDTDKLIAEQLLTLPVALQRAIALTPWRSLVATVAGANQLQGDAMKSLEAETMLVIYRFESQDDFVGNLMRELSIDNTRATLLAGEVDKQIFAPILTKANEVAQEIKPEVVSTVVAEYHTELPVVNKQGDKPTLEERKHLVPNIPDNRVHYKDSPDPYREPI